VLADFIEQNVQTILDDWRQFADRLALSDRHLSAVELENSARDMLSSIVDDMRHDQSEQRRADKSHGDVPDNAPQITRTARSHAQSRFAQGFTIDHVVVEYRALRASVTRHWLGSVAVSHDHGVTDLVRFNESMDQALSESVAHFSSELNRLRDIFLGVLAHDLRTPLSAATLFAECIVLDAGTPPRSIEAAVRIQRSTKQMKMLVDGLLDLTHTRLGRVLPISPTHANMQAICEHAAAELRAISPSTELTVALEGDLRGVWDASRVSQLISNLLVNAVRHGKPGGPVSLVATEGDSDTVTVTVTNEGQAIPKEIIAGLFEPFVHGDSGGKSHTGAGLGLGLFIARQIALAHRGRLDVVSDDRQTEFRLSIPRQKSVEVGRSPVV
jgi:signal transduction histidine kinase